MDYPEFVAAVREMVREGDLARLMMVPTVPAQRDSSGLDERVDG